MDTQELYKIFGQRLENALKSKENFKGKNQIKFIEIEDGTCCFHYRGQDFTVEWWTYEKEQCINAHSTATKFRQLKSTLTSSHSTTV